MSTLQITLNLTGKSWKIKNNIDQDAMSMSLQINVSDAETANINHLNFGYKLFLEESEISQDRFPPTGTVNYIRSSNIIDEVIHVSANTNYKLYLWAENAADRIEQTFDVRTPPPSQPYPSWSWSGSEWVAPIPLPLDGPENAAYKWSEKQQKWILLVPPLGQYDDI